MSKQQANTKKKTSSKKNTTTTRKRRSDAKMNATTFEMVCKDIEVSTDGLHTICKRYDSSASAFYDYLDKDKTNKYAERYARAKDRQTEYFNDLQRDIAFDRSRDDTAFTGGNHVQRDKLIIGTLQWQQAKTKPKKYGDKLEVDNKGEVTVSFKQEKK